MEHLQETLDEFRTELQERFKDIGTIEYKNSIIDDITNVLNTNFTAKQFENFMKIRVNFVKLLAIQNHFNIKLHTLVKKLKSIKNLLL